MPAPALIDVVAGERPIASEGPEDFIRQRVTKAVTENPTDRLICVGPDSEGCEQVFLSDERGAIQRGVYHRESQDLGFCPGGNRTSKTGALSREGSVDVLPDFPRGLVSLHPINPASLFKGSGDRAGEVLQELIGETATLREFAGAACAQPDETVGEAGCDLCAIEVAEQFIATDVARADDVRTRRLRRAVLSQRLEVAMIPGAPSNRREGVPLALYNLQDRSELFLQDEQPLVRDPRVDHFELTGPN